MNKFISFFIIIFIIYISYNYCSDNIIEGIGIGDYSEDNDNSVEAPITCTAEDGGLVTDENMDNLKDEIRKPICFKDTICGNIFNESVSDKWTYNGYDKGNKQKMNCSKCLMGSEKVGTIVNAVSNVAVSDTNTDPKSNFALDYCDALVAGCDDPFIYANNHQEWSQKDCAQFVGKPSLTTSGLLCTILTNSFTQFIMSFMGGITCTVKIQTKKLMSSIEGVFDDIGKGMKCGATLGLACD
jgi:hypothetical protein